MTRPKDKGTAAETLVVKYLQSTYWPYAERRALSGGQDKGDITGTPGLCWEVKSAKTLCVPAWLRETEVERVNSGADYATLVIKPVGVGGTRVGEWYALMDREKFGKVWKEAWADREIRFLLSEAYIVYTTPRRNALNQIQAMKQAASPRSMLWWAHYETRTGDYTFTSLWNMVCMLRLAGYGSVQ